MDHPERRTKIVATIGPACWDEPVLRRVILAGMDVARLNFSHGTHERHLQTLRTVRELGEELGRPVAVLQDLQGPKIRVGSLVDGKPIELHAGERLDVTTRDIVGGPGRISTTYKGLADDVARGETILMDDGLLQLRVLDVRGDTVECEIEVGGLLREHKGINLPNTRLSAPALTAKDIEDIALGVEHDVDYIALSFVRGAADIRQAREAIRAAGGDIPVIAKIERPEAMEHLEAILDESDAVMVARGDLATETSIADVPVFQKRITRLSGRKGRPDITATEMLQSMVENPRPTRAEACDVANAVFDGTDALMLSGETAMGKYPVEAVLTMSTIAERAERELAVYGRDLGADTGDGSVAGVTAHAACVAAREVGARLIACVTRTGRTAVRLSQLRPTVPIVALTPDPRAYRRLALPWGVIPVRTEEASDARELRLATEAALLREGGCAPGDLVVLVTGDTVTAGATNTIHVIRLGAANG